MNDPDSPKFGCLYGMAKLRPEFAVRLQPETWLDRLRRYARTVIRPWEWPMWIIRLLVIGMATYAIWRLSRP